MTTPQPYSSSSAAPAQGDSYNILAIVGFIASFFVSIVGIVLGFVALSQIKRTGEKGRGLALAAVIIGFVAIALTVLFVVLFVVAAASIDPATYSS